MHRVTRVGPSVRAEGYIGLTPQAFLERLDRTDGLDVIFREHEQHESEAVIADGRRRNFWKVVRSCRNGSRFIAVVIAES